MVGWHNRSAARLHGPGSEHGIGRLKVSAILLCAAGGALIAPSIASAATDASTPAVVNVTEVPEVTVEARRERENIQAVPISVTAVSATELKQQNINQVTELTNTVPSLTITTGFSGFDFGYAIRGLSAGVTQYFEGAACCSALAAAPFYDIQSVEVLNGPQGTLFGRSSASGAILISPVHPSMDQFGGFADFTTGDYGRAQFTGAVDIPIVKDRVAARFATYINHIDGYTSAIGSNLRFDDQNNQQFRLGVEFKSTKFDDYIVASYEHINQSAPGSVLTGIDLNGLDGLYNLPAFVLENFVFQTPTGGGPCPVAVAHGLSPNLTACVTQHYNILQGISATLAAENARVSAGGNAIRFEPAPANGLGDFVRGHDFNILNVTQYDLGDVGSVNVQLKDLFSYDSAAAGGAFPVDGIGGIGEAGGAFAEVGIGGNNEIGNKAVFGLGPDQPSWNNDFQVHLHADHDLLVGTLGVFYSGYTTPVGAPNNLGNVYQIVSGVLNANLGYNTAYAFSDGGNGSEVALYTQETLDASRWIHGLKITLGYRYSWDNSYYATLPAVEDVDTGVYYPGSPKTISTTSSSGFNYDLTATEQVTNNLMAYVNVSRAYIPGGINTVVPSTAGAPANYTPTYGPETLLTEEIGVKTDFKVAGIAGRVDADVYHYNFTNIQEPFQGVIQGGSTNIVYTENIAAASLRGFEMSATLLPTPELEMRMAYNYNDFSYTKWTGQDPYNAASPGDPLCVSSSPAGQCYLDLTKNPALGMPRHQGHITVVYHAPLDPALGHLDLSATLYGQSRVYFVTTAVRQLQLLPGALEGISQDPYATLNLRANWSNVIGSQWAAAVFINNVANQIYKTGEANQLTTLGFSEGTYGPPRMFGVEFSRKF